MYIHFFSKKKLCSIEISLSTENKVTAVADRRKWKPGQPPRLKIEGIILIAVIIVALTFS